MNWRNNARAPELGRTSELARPLFIGTKRVEVLYIQQSRVVAFGKEARHLGV